MKKIITLAIISSILTLSISACGSTSGGCDAYGSTQNTEKSQDLASK
jgi:hypothetical protein